MSNKQEKMSKADILNTLRCGFDLLALENKGGRGNKARQGTAYVPDPVKLDAMAKRIMEKAEADPTRLGGETLEDILPS